MLTCTKPELVATRPLIQVGEGRAFPLDNFGPADIYINDIARSLSRKVRFSGLTVLPYTVSQHSVRGSLAEGIDIDLQKWMLFHDAAETYTGDISGVAKHWFGGDRLYHLDRWLTYAIAKRFGLSWPVPKDIKFLDMALLLGEAKALFLGLNTEIWQPYYRIYEEVKDGRPDPIFPPIVLDSMSDDTCCSEFLDRFHELFGRG